MSESGDIGTTAGQRLRAAREEKGLSLEDIASHTRIPRRHLESIEQGDWERLPAPTYSIGFAKSYASAVGLDRAEIGEQLRAEMGGQRAEKSAAPEVFQPADPARTMPRWLVLSALGAILLLVLVMSWLSNRSLEAPGATVAPPEAGAPAGTVPAQAPQQPQAAGGPVVLTATAPAWIQVKDQGRTLYEGELATGQSFPVPQTATAPLLRVGAPEALRITVGGATVPPVGPAGQVTSNVSLRGSDLMRAGTQPVPPAPSAPPGIQNTAG
jgi:cytoskeletal protein RodZ